MTCILTSTARVGEAADAPSAMVRGSGGKAAVVVDGKIFRQIDARSRDAAERIADMADDGIDIQVLSPMPELLSHWLPPELADHLSTVVNDHISEMVNYAPSKFIGIGMVPMQNVGLATLQLGDLSRSRFCGVEIGTHINGLPLGDARFDPFYKRGAELGLTIFVHPLHPAGPDRVGNPPELAAVAAFPLDTTLAATSLIAGQVTQRFPNLRMLSHGGGSLAWIAPRLEFARVTMANVGNALSDRFYATLKRFWYDTVVYYAACLRLLSETVGVDRLVIGSDYPFVIRQLKPASFRRLHSRWLILNRTR